MISRSQARPLVIFILLVLILAALLYHQRSAVVHFTRPVFQSPAPAPPTFLNLGFLGPEDCQLYNMTPRAPLEPGKRLYDVRFYDVVLFNNEVDMLEVRMNELADSVDFFVITESDRTFTGLPKPLHLVANAAKFKHLWSKIIHLRLIAGTVGPHPGVFRRELVHVVDKVHESPWQNEAFQRTAYRSIIARLKDVAPRNWDLIIFADLDEIPRPATLQIFRECDATELNFFPVRLHMAFYYYSFEFRVRDNRWWQALVARYEQINEIKREGATVLRVFLDAGWHCSWCFRTIEEFIAKVEAYSHTEHNQEMYKDPKRIQQYICEGRDLFDRWTEETSFREIIRNLDGTFEAQDSVVGLPEVLTRDRQKFGYLLPGQCQRPPAVPM